ncbi:MAG: OFA family MFS transporter [Clostridiales bacterium]|nr:OFA family MFS transporter [Clostridiales bacterium]
MEKATNKDGIKVLVAGSVLQLFLGIIYVWSVFVQPVSEALVWDIDKVKLTSSYMLCCFVLGILAGGRLQAKISASKIVLAGGILMAIGMLVTSFVSGGAAWLIYITYGIIGGFGVGMAYNTVISSAQKWFPKKRGLATGISVCTFGFSTVIFAPLVQVLIKSFGLDASFRILAAAFAVITVLLFSFIKMPTDSGVKTSSPQEVQTQKQYTVGEILKTKEFYFIALSMMLLTAAYFILNPSFKTFAQDRGFSDTIGTVIVMLTGIASAVGRLAVPAMADKIGYEKSAIIIMIATAVCTALLCFASGILFMAAIAVIAFCYGGSSGIYPVITSEQFGLKNVGANYGAVMVGFALSALFFPMLIGLIGSVIVKFLVLTALALIGALMIVLLSLSKKENNNKRNVKNAHN